jgi:transcriptional antiterminator RfaH
MGRNELPAWYVLRTKPRAEGIAADHLQRKEITVYFPKYEVGRERSQSRTHAGRESIEPLFPGYLFARLSLSEQYYAAAWSPGVRNFLSFGEGTAEPVGEEVIACLRQRAGGGDIFRPLSGFRQGEQVEITKGPLAGLLAVIDRPVPAAGRVKVLLEILRRQTRVELPVSAVARL